MKKISDKRLKKLGGKMPFSTIAKKASKPIRKVNPKAKAKRTAGYRKMLAGKEYRDARAEALRRAEGRCEMLMSGIERCPETYRLQAHHCSYPKSRPLRSSDLLMVCRWHHEYLESQKMGKTRMF